MSGERLTGEAVAEAVAELGEQARRALGDPGATLGATYELRYRGQAFELPINAAVDAEPSQLRVAFEAMHEDRYGYSDSDQALELVTIRVTATTGGPDVQLADSDEPETVQRGRRVAILAGGRGRAGNNTWRSPARDRALTAQRCRTARVDPARPGRLVRRGRSRRHDPVESADADSIGESPGGRFSVRRDR